MSIYFEHKIVIILLPTGLNKCLCAEKNHFCTEYKGMGESFQDYFSIQDFEADFPASKC